MKNGYRVIDMDTHVNPTVETLIKYMEPAFRARKNELKPFQRTVDFGTGPASLLTVAPFPYDRFPGEAPKEERAVAGGRGALEGRVTESSSHHRVPPRP